MMESKYFTPDEIKGLKRELLDKLFQARTLAGVPFIITSGLREGDPRSHGKGLAVDLLCTDSRNRLRIVGAAILSDFLRVGVYNHHIHLDCDPALPQNVMWWGVSR